jgi:hypothetical protein
MRLMPIFLLSKAFTWAWVLPRGVDDVAHDFAVQLAQATATSQGAGGGGAG